MVSVLVLSVVSHGFKPQSGQTKDYKIGICCLPTIKVLNIKETSEVSTNTGWLEIMIYNVFE